MKKAMRKIPSNVEFNNKGQARIKPGSKAKPLEILPPPKKRDFTEGDLNDLLKDGNLTPDDAPTPYVEESERKGTSRLRTTKQATEFRRAQVHRLVLRGVPRQTIADHLGVSLETIYSDIKNITHDMREELRNMDYTMYIGMSMAFYDECRNLALRLATDTAEKNNSVKMQALRTAIAAEDAKHNFFARVGLFKVVSPTDPFNSIQTGRQGSYSDENDLNVFMQSIAEAARGTRLIDNGVLDVPDPAN
jgi:hypothetical protein